MNCLYQDVAYRNMLVHSEARHGRFVLQLLKSHVVVQEQSFADWEAYSRQYDMVLTMLKTRARLGY